MQFSPDPNFQPESYFPKIFMGELNRLMDATMPKSFLKGFPAMAEKAQRFPYIPGRLRLGVLSNWNEQEKIIAAFAKEAGEALHPARRRIRYAQVQYDVQRNGGEPLHLPQLGLVL